MKKNDIARPVHISIMGYDQGSVVPKAKGVKINKKKNKLFESFKDILFRILTNSNNHHNYSNIRFFLR